MVASFVALPFACGLLFRLVAGAKGGMYGIATGLVLSLTLTGLFVKVPAFQQAVLQTIEPEDTVTAPGFREELFERIRPGMAASEVLDVLGQPLERVEIKPHTQLWRYTKQGPKDTNYRIRSVELADGRVSEVVRSFFVD